MDVFEINTRKLYEKLHISKKTKYSDWINHKIEKFHLKEDIDYKIIYYGTCNFSKKEIKNMSTQKRSAYGINVDYYIKKEIALNICRYARNNIYVKEVIEYFNLEDLNKEIIIQEAPRLEYQFGDMLEKITELNILTQYTIPNENNNGFYKLDFYIPNILIIEYDETRHQYYTYKQQEGRQVYCQKWLAANETNGKIIDFIRVKQGKELEGIHDIIKYLNDLDVKIK